MLRSTHELTQMMELKKKRVKTEKLVTIVPIFYASGMGE
jgi:hypothetical protein